MFIDGLLYRFVTAPGSLRLALPAVVLLLSAQAIAVPLDRNACAKLMQDMQNMKALDVDKLMEKGPSWAVSHLSSSDLTLIRQYIDLDEQLKFRCAAPSTLVHLKHLDEEDEEGAPKPAPETAGNGAENPQGASEPAEATTAKPKVAKAAGVKKPKLPAPVKATEAH